MGEKEESYGAAYACEAACYAEDMRVVGLVEKGWKLPFIGASLGLLLMNLGLRRIFSFELLEKGRE